MDIIRTNIYRTQRVITRAVLQVQLLNRHLAEIQTRYDHAREMKLSMWVYKLRMRTLTVEGVKNVFMHFLEEKMEKLDEYHEDQYALGLVLNQAVVNVPQARGTDEEWESDGEWDTDSSFQGADEELASLGL